MLAMSALSADWTAIFYVIAFVALLISAFIAWPGWRSWNFFLSLGLAAWMFVNAWNALAAT